LVRRGFLFSLPLNFHLSFSDEREEDVQARLVAALTLLEKAPHARASSDIGKKVSLAKLRLQNTQDHLDLARSISSASELSEADKKVDEAMELVDELVEFGKQQAEEIQEVAKSVEQDAMAAAAAKKEELIQKISSFMDGDVMTEVVNVLQMLTNGLQRTSSTVNRIKLLFGGGRTNGMYKQGRGKILLEDLATTMDKLIVVLRNGSPMLQEKLVELADRVERTATSHVKSASEKAKSVTSITSAGRHRQLQLTLALADASFTNGALSARQRQLVAETLAVEHHAMSGALASARKTAKSLASTCRQISEACGPVVEDFERYARLGAICNALLGCFILILIFVFAIRMHAFKATVDQDNDGSIDLLNAATQLTGAS
jgi:hypothetical protein